MAWFLVVEDDPLDASVLSMAFEQAGVAAEMIRAPDGEAAILRLDEAAVLGDLPAFVLSDMRLPGMPGNELVRRIRARPSLRGLPVIMYTGSTMKQDEQAARVAGVDHFFSKPSEIDALVAECRNMSDTWLSPRA